MEEWICSAGEGEEEITKKSYRTVRLALLIPCKTTYYTFLHSFSWKQYTVLQCIIILYTYSIFSIRMRKNIIRKIANSVIARFYKNSTKIIL